MYAIDKLGGLRAEIKRLQDEARRLEQEIKDAGHDVDGLYFHGSVSHSERSTVDWKAVAAKLNPSRQLVTAHTKVSEVVTLRVSAHRKAA